MGLQRDFNYASRVEAGIWPSTEKEKKIVNHDKLQYQQGGGSGEAATTTPATQTQPHPSDKVTGDQSSKKNGEGRKAKAQ